MKFNFAKLFLFLSLLLFTTNSFLLSQNIYLEGLPLIKNYLPSEHGGTPQNWGIVQDKRGVMYFANTAGVLEYDGVNWRLIEIENGVARTIAIDDKGTIFVGGIDQFGYLQPNAQGKLEYQSLISLLPVEQKNFGDIWSIWPSKQGVFFQSASYLFLIKNPIESLSNKESYGVKHWKSKSVFNPAYIVDDNFFMLEAGTGLLTLKGDSLILANDGERFANSTIYSMLDFSGSDQHNSGTKKILLGTDEGFYIYDRNTASSFKTEADNYVIKNQLYFRGAILNDNTYAFGTQNGGLVVIDSNGKLKKIINKFSGLNDNTVWYVYPGIAGELWLATNNGISRINYPSPLTILDSHFGLDGVIYSLNEHRGKIYITTTNGIYYTSGSGNFNLNSTFRKIDGVNSESWEILDLGDYQLVGTTNGVFKIDDIKSTQIKSDWRFAYSLYQSKLDKNLIYVGLHDGIATLRLNNGEWIDGGRIPGVTEIILGIVEDAEGTVWLSTLNKGLIKLAPFKTDNHSSYSITRYGKEKGVVEKQSIPIPINNNVHFATSDGFISYDKEKDLFIADDKLGERFIGNYLTVDAKKDLEGNILVMGGKNSDFEIGKIVFDKNREPSWKAYPILNNILENDLMYAQYHIYPDKYSSDIIWIAANEKLYKFNTRDSLSTSTTQKYCALIRRVKINSDSTIYYGNELKVIPSEKDGEWNLDAGLSSIEFSFASASYFKESANRYQYYLEGFEQGWSEWTNETRKEYTNLPTGSYNFRIRAINTLNQLSEESTFAFYIPAPWFKSIWAFILYAALILFLMWWLVNWRLKFLEKRTVELEAIVSERTKEVREQKNTLEEQAKKLVELDRLKSNFFTNISHEFRTPLTLIMGQIENVLDATSEEKVRSKLKMVLTNSKRLHALINQLLELSRLEAGEIKLKITTIELNKYLKKILAAFESYAERKNINLEFIGVDKDLNVFGDLEKLEEIFNNLISNAIKFTADSGRISLIINDQKDDTNLEIIVRDTGIGISEEALLHIFDRFYQVDSSQTREYEGTGIGLAIVKELIELHEGSIEAKSIKGKGTEFIIHLRKGTNHFLNKPFVEFIEDNEAGSAINIVTEKPILPFESFHDVESEEQGIDVREVVLVVEDNAEMRSYIQEQLSDNFNVVVAKHGEEGVNKALEIVPDLIITDVMMPVMNGYDLTLKLKNDQRTSHIPIIMLTAKADEQSKLKGLDLGVDDYLIKPFSKKELFARVGNLIKLRTLLKERYKEVSAISLDKIEAKPIDQEFLEKVFSSIKNHLEDPQYGITKLAEEVGMSVSQLNRKLNGLINQTAGKLIRSTKLDYAAQLLKSGTGNISEIAYRVGFSDTPSFSHSFKEKFGYPPSEHLKS